MALNLNSEQEQVVNAILRVARRKRATPMEVKAAFATGIVESNLRNLNYGDADSQGWRQERRSLYPDPTNLTASIGRFFDETKAVRGKYGNAAQLAAAVQRPAAQYRGRYADVAGQADQLLQRFIGGGSSSGGAPAPAGAPSASAVQAPAQSNGAQLAAVLMAAQQEKQPRPSMGLALPAAAAGPVMPVGARPVMSQPVRSPGAQLTDALTAIRALGGQEGVEAPDVPAGAPEGGQEAPRGRVAPIRSGGGYGGSQGVARSLASIGHALGLQTTSTKRHNTNPYSGDNSDHDHGKKNAYAYDISSGGAPNESMDRTAYRIMRRLGFKDYEMGQPINTQRGVKTIRTKQGTYRVQVIYRGSGAAFGGNHLNHVHIGVERVGR